MSDTATAGMTTMELIAYFKAKRLKENKEQASRDFETVLGKRKSVVHSFVILKVDGTEYLCAKRTRPGWNALLWINVRGETSGKRAVFEAKTKKMRASIFFDVNELLQIMPCLSD